MRSAGLIGMIPLVLMLSVPANAATTPVDDLRTEQSAAAGRSTSQPDSSPYNVYSSANDAVNQAVDATTQAINQAQQQVDNAMQQQDQQVDAAVQQAEQQANAEVLQAQQQANAAVQQAMDASTGATSPVPPTAQR